MRAVFARGDAMLQPPACVSVTAPVAHAAFLWPRRAADVAQRCCTHARPMSQRVTATNTIHAQGCGMSSVRGAVFCSARCASGLGMQAGAPGVVNMDAAGRTEVCMMAVRCFPYGLGSDFRG